MGNRVNARVAGILLIVATVANLLGAALANSIVKGSSYLTRAYAEHDRVFAGVFLLMLAAFACAGIAISLFPVLRRYGEGLAVGSVCFRVVEGVLYLVGAVAVLMMVTLSQEFVKAGSPSSSNSQTTGVLLRAIRDRAGLMGSMAFYVGGLMYYYLFLRSRLLPRWLSGWGLAGAALGLVAGILTLFGAIGYMSSTHVGLNIPIGVNEMVLAVWLIVRGFASPPVPTRSRPEGPGESPMERAAVS